MMGAVKSAMRDCDALVALVDVTHGRDELLEMLQPPPDRKGPPMLIVLNKVDLVSEAEAEEAKVRTGVACRPCCAALCLCGACGSALEAMGVWAYRCGGRGTAGARR